MIMSKGWKCIFGLVLVSIAIIISINIYSLENNNVCSMKKIEQFGIPPSPEIMAKKNDSETAAIAKGERPLSETAGVSKEQVREDLNKKLDSTLGDVLLEWDVED